ncbi:putative transferase [Rosa chinensis]|uniref:diacylglycerol O-acyltransferase n=1 Tax=Rosa chinensis TaxID=74649 RepID=A0A2P6PA50_ROSCH|nr:putative transferase [Rosa chinensis]
MLLQGLGCSEKKRWERVSVKIEDHVIVPNLDSEMKHAEQFVDQYISNLTTSPLDLSKPLWEVHILNVKTSDAEAVAVIRIHHSMGDGASLMSLLLACARKTSGSLMHCLLFQPRGNRRIVLQTINDVILGVTQAGFSRYLNNRYGKFSKCAMNHFSLTVAECSFPRFLCHLLIQTH